MTTQDTHIAATLKAQRDGTQIKDKQVKELLANKQVLARILKYTIDELSDLSIEEIMDAIPNDSIKISSYRLDPSEKDGAAKLEATEDYQAGEGTIYYDIRFSVILPNLTLDILINIEAQISIEPQKLGYHIENRMTYYLARMVSHQKNHEFSGQDYDKIKKCRSIWICLDEKCHDCIEEFRFERKMKYGSPSNIAVPDLMRGIVVHLRLRKEFSDSKHELISMLEDLIANKPAQDKLERLKKQHGFTVNQEITKEVGDMGGWAEYIAERYKEEYKKDVEMETALKFLQRDGSNLRYVAETAEIPIDDLRDAAIAKGIIARPASTLN